MLGSEGRAGHLGSWQRRSGEYMADTFRDHLGGTELEALYDYWDSKREHGALPARADIDPIELRGLLRHVVLAEVVDGGERIRYRLVGTGMVERWGADFTGKHVDEIMQGSYRDFLMRLFQDSIDNQCAVFSRSQFRWDVGRSLDTSRLFLPLSEDGETVDMILIGQIFGDDVGSAQPVVLTEQGRSHEETVRVLEATV